MAVTEIAKHGGNRAAKSKFDIVRSSHECFQVYVSRFWEAKYQRTQTGNKRNNTFRKGCFNFQIPIQKLQILLVSCSFNNNYFLSAILFVRSTAGQVAINTGVYFL